MVVILITLNLIIVGFVIAGARDHRLTEHRLRTIQAFYAAESGMNMAIREMMEDADEDLDGFIGTISDDSNDATDPQIGPARFVVTINTNSPDVGLNTLTSNGRSGESRRSMKGVME